MNINKWKQTLEQLLPISSTETSDNVSPKKTEKQKIRKNKRNEN